MVQAHIGLSEKVREQVSQKLAVILGNQAVLYIKTLKFHWNIRGIGFKAHHVFLQEQYEAILQLVDDTAERIRTLGFMAPGTMQEFLKSAELKENPGENPIDKEMFSILLQDHESIIRIIRKEIDVTADLGDQGTNNFLCDIMERHEKMAWMLRAHVE